LNLTSKEVVESTAKFVSFFSLLQQHQYKLDAPLMMSVLSARHVEIGPASIPVSKKIPAVRVPDVQFQIIKQLVHVLLALRVTHSSDVYLVSWLHHT